MTEKTEPRSYIAENEELIQKITLLVIFMGGLLVPFSHDPRLLGISIVLLSALVSWISRSLFMFLRALLAGGVGGLVFGTVGKLFLGVNITLPF